MEKAIRTSLIIGGSLALFGLFMYFKNKKGVKKANKKIIIGDSHAVGIGSASTNVEVDKKIATGGWMVSNLINALQNYPTRNDVDCVIVSIGTNGQFSSNDKIEDLVKLIKNKFPKSNIYIFRGSYGWSGSRTQNQILDRLVPYYKRFEKSGVIVLKNQLGYFKDGGEAHSTKTPQAIEIIKEINEL